MQVAVAAARLARSGRPDRSRLSVRRSLGVVRSRVGVCRLRAVGAPPLDGFRDGGGRLPPGRCCGRRRLAAASSARSACATSFCIPSRSARDVAFPASASVGLGLGDPVVGVRRRRPGRGQRRPAPASVGSCARVAASTRTARRRRASVDAVEDTVHRPGVEPQPRQRLLELRGRRRPCRRAAACGTSECRPGARCTGRPLTSSNDVALVERRRRRPAPSSRAAMPPSPPTCPASAAAASGCRSARCHAA